MPERILSATQKDCEAVIILQEQLFTKQQNVTNNNRNVIVPKKRTLFPNKIENAFLAKNIRRAGFLDPRFDRFWGSENWFNFSKIWKKLETKFVPGEN